MPVHEFQNNVCFKKNCDNPQYCITTVDCHAYLLFEIQIQIDWHSQKNTLKLSSSLMRQLNFSWHKMNSLNVLLLFLDYITKAETFKIWFRYLSKGQLRQKRALKSWLMTSFLTSFLHILPLCVGGVGDRARGSAAAWRALAAAPGALPASKRGLSQVHTLHI